MSRTLSLYVVREVAQYAVVGFLAVSVILISNNAIRYVDLLAGAGFSLDDVLAVLGCLVAILGAPAVPIALLFGILLGIGRLSSDSEITAMRASGLGLSALMVPTLLLALLVSAATAHLLMQVEPAARREFRTLKASLASRTAFLVAGEFRQIGDRVFFVREANKDSQLEGIVISDRSNAKYPMWIFAETGRLSVDVENAEGHLLLDDGEIHLEIADGDDAYRRWSFESFDYAFDLSAMVAAQSKHLRPREMTRAQLDAALARAAAGETLDDMKERNPLVYELQVYRRLALPVAPVVFALIGVPLALRSGRGARALGAMLCVAVLFAYYSLMSVFEDLSEEGMIRPLVAVWLPNVVFALASVPLLWRAAGGYDAR